MDSDIEEARSLPHSPLTTARAMVPVPKFRPKPLSSPRGFNPFPKNRPPRPPPRLKSPSFFLLTPALQKLEISPSNSGLESPSDSVSEASSGEEVLQKRPVLITRPGAGTSYKKAFAKFKTAPKSHIKQGGSSALQLSNQPNVATAALETMSNINDDVVTPRVFSESDSEVLSEIEADPFNIRSTGAKRFSRARLMTARREGFVRTVKREMSDVGEKLKSLSLKTAARLKELRTAIDIQESKMKSFKSAYRKATVKEMNEIVSAGWCRTGKLGFINLKELLQPYFANQRMFPSGVISPINTGPFLQTLSKSKSTKLQPKRIIPYLIPPKFPKFRPQHIQFGCGSCTIDEKNRRYRQDRQGITRCIMPDNIASDSNRKDKAQTDISVIGGDDGGTDVGSICSDSSNDEDYEENNFGERRMTLLHLVNQLNSLGPQQSFDRQTISTYLMMHATEHSVTADVPPPLGTGSLRDGDTNLTDLVQNNSTQLDSNDVQEIKSILETIKSPRFLGFRLNSKVGRFLQIHVEPTDLYKKKVAKKLQSYYIKEKKFREKCVGILPGGLSSVSLVPPPAPKYPEGGLLSPESSFSSEGVLSDILSELGGESEADEDDFTALFEKGEREIIQRAVESHGKNSIEFDKKPRSRRHDVQEIFSTTFEVGVKLRVPKVLMELSKVAQDTQSLNMTFQPLEFPSGTQSRCLEPLEYCVDAVEEKKFIGCKPAEVTEFWQLAQDVNKPVWIFRGRLVKALG